MRVYQIWRVELDSFALLQAGSCFKDSLSLVFSASTRNLKMTIACTRRLACPFLTKLTVYLSDRAAFAQPLVPAYPVILSPPSHFPFVRFGGSRWGSFAGGLLLHMSNFCCLPGRAGGLLG
jgi:hypothetical protein